MKEEYSWETIAARRFADYSAALAGKKLPWPRHIYPGCERRKLGLRNPDGNRNGLRGMTGHEHDRESAGGSAPAAEKKVESGARRRPLFRS